MREGYIATAVTLCVVCYHPTALALTYYTTSVRLTSLVSAARKWF